MGDVYWASKIPYPSSVNLSLNNSHKKADQFTSGQKTFHVTRTVQTNVKTSATRKVKNRLVTEDDLAMNPIILKSIQGYLSSGWKVIILTHNSGFVPGGSNAILLPFLTKHLGSSDASKIDIVLAQPQKSKDIINLGIEVFHDDSVNVLQEIKKNTQNVKLYQVFPNQGGAMKLY